MELILIRHGMTKGNIEKRYIGVTDEPLSDKGALQIHENCLKGMYPKAETLSYMKAQIFSSPMKRCIQTAKIIYPELPAIIIPEWTEMNFGSFEYKNYDELKKETEYIKWLDSGGTSAFPGGEDRKMFTERTIEGMRNAAALMDANRKANRTNRNRFAASIDANCKANRTNRNRFADSIDANCKAVCIVHGGTIMALLYSLYGGDYYDYQVPNGQGYRCELIMSSGKPKIINLARL